jgi:hypothetical protein
MNEPEDALVRVQGLRKEYGSGGGLVRAVDEVDLEVARGETLAVMGPSRTICSDHSHPRHRAAPTSVTRRSQSGGGTRSWRWATIQQPALPRHPIPSSRSLPTPRRKRRSAARQEQ